MDPPQPNAHAPMSRAARAAQIIGNRVLPPSILQRIKRRRDDDAEPTAYVVKQGQAHDFMARLNKLTHQPAAFEIQEQIESLGDMISITHWPLNKSYIAKDRDHTAAERFSCHTRSLSADFCNKEPMCEYRPSKARPGEVKGWTIAQTAKNADAIQFIDAHGTPAEQERAARIRTLTGELERLSSSDSDDPTVDEKIESVRAKINAQLGGLCELKSDMQRWGFGAVVRMRKHYYVNRGIFEGQFLAKTVLLQPVAAPHEYVMVFRYHGDGDDHKDFEGMRSQLISAVRACCKDTLIHPTHYQQDVERVPNMPLSLAHIPANIKLHTGYFGMAISLLCNTALLATLATELIDKVGRWRVTRLTLVGFSLGSAMSHMFTFLMIAVVLPHLHRVHIAPRYQHEPMPHVVNLSAGGPRTGNTYYAQWFAKQQRDGRLTMNHYIVAETHVVDVNDVHSPLNIGTLDPCACFPAVDPQQTDAAERYSTVGNTIILCKGEMYRDTDAAFANSISFTRDCYALLGTLTNKLSHVASSVATYTGAASVATADRVQQAIKRQAYLPESTRNMTAQLATGVGSLVNRGATATAGFITRTNHWLHQRFQLPGEYERFWCIHDLNVYANHTMKYGDHRPCFTRPPKATRN
jgi:hypothetical protein